MYQPVQTGGAIESSQSGWQTTTVSSVVMYPSIHEYVYVCRYVIWLSNELGTGSVNTPFSSPGQVIATTQHPENLLSVIFI